jgi:hypothetical protein
MAFFQRIEYMDEIVNSITPQTAFIPKPRVYTVTNPNGTRSLAPYPTAPIPQNILKMGQGNKNTLNAWFGSTHPSGYSYPNFLRSRGARKGFRGVNTFQGKKQDLIRFIIAAYYEYQLYPFPNTQYENKIKLMYFRQAYAKLTTRNARNTSKIPVEQMYRLLSSLNIPTLKKLAVILEW